MLLTPDYATERLITGLTEPQFQFPDALALTSEGQYCLWIIAYQYDNAGHPIEAYQLEAMLELSLE